MNILVAGRHGSLTDTMIFAHIDHKKHTIDLISVPRDLQVNGSKINSIYAHYGIDELARQLSKILGYKIDKYILIDMYAFRDVIDLVGGIDVTLEHAVIDPSYRVVDDGVEGTLSYKPGTYHLNGTEALRIARSRHYSSDFDRAARQHVILSSLKDKAKGLGFGDATTLAAIVKAVLDKTETNINVQEALSYYFRYQNFSINKGYVLSGANVLYSSSYQVGGKPAGNELISECQPVLSGSSSEEGDDAASLPAGCGDLKHSYILLPRNNNWDLIKWYVNQVLEGKINEKVWN